MNRFFNFRRAALLAAVCSTVSHAYAADKIYAPYVTKGELELEYFGSVSNDNNDSKDNAQKHQFAVGYGVTDYWFTEVYGKFSKPSQDNFQFSDVEWENIFQFTDRGEYWVDAGASLAYEWTPESDEADKMEARLLLAKEIGRTSHLLNAKAEKEVGGGPRASLEGKLLWSSRYRHTQTFEPGFEISSDFGELKHTGSFNEQKHAIGPAAYGKIPLNLTDKADSLKYRVGYLVGVSDAAPDGDALLHLEYELHF
ncbi:MAG: hypothetical protein SFW64_06515 [Alphaproteobacteria bacterium]|nr:hypothetical protein [Alphaproteobacteria bacterium]